MVFATNTNKMIHVFYVLRLNTVVHV